MEGELTLLHRDVEGLLYAVNDRDEGSLFTFDLDLRGSYAQPAEDEGLEDMVCDLVLRATHGDGLRGERYPIEVPRTCEVLDSDARLRLLGSSLAHEAVPRTIAPRRRAAAHCLIYILLC